MLNSYTSVLLNDYESINTVTTNLHGRSKRSDKAFYLVCWRFLEWLRKSRVFARFDVFIFSLTVSAWVQARCMAVKFWCACTQFSTVIHDACIKQPVFLLLFLLFIYMDLWDGSSWVDISLFILQDSPGLEVVIEVQAQPALLLPQARARLTGNQPQLTTACHLQVQTTHANPHTL